MTCPTLPADFTTLINVDDPLVYYLAPPSTPSPFVIGCCPGSLGSPCWPQPVLQKVQPTRILGIWPSATPWPLPPTALGMPPLALEPPLPIPPALWDPIYWQAFHGTPRPLRPLQQASHGTPPGITIKWDPVTNRLLTCVSPFHLHRPLPSAHALWPWAWEPWDLRPWA